MEGYEDRLVDEHAALQENTEKLEKFIASKPYSEVSLQDQSYLEDQLKCQKSLLRVLTSRMEIAKNKEEAAKTEATVAKNKVEPIKK